ncbi:hypothetical protein, partial [Fulvivirga lutimaris]|uniref:hypothetical protein n=1 Tax=Fulvivirga lutimaris TaxID=1819566 RepID=UPI001C877ED2
STGFEGGLDVSWLTFNSNSTLSRIQVTTDNSPIEGSEHLTMDANASGTFVQNEAWLHLDLSSETDVDLSFFWKEFGDENQTGLEGLYFSDNAGASFTQVAIFGGEDYADNTWLNIKLDVDQLAIDNGLTLSATFVIKFQQYDNASIPDDGFAFDDINI